MQGAPQGTEVRIYPFFLVGLFARFMPSPAQLIPPGIVLRDVHGWGQSTRVRSDRARVNRPDP